MNSRSMRRAVAMLGMSGALILALCGCASARQSAVVGTGGIELRLRCVATEQAVPDFEAQVVNTGRNPAEIRLIREVFPGDVVVHVVSHASSGRPVCVRLRMRGWLILRLSACIHWEEVTLAPGESVRYRLKLDTLLTLEDLKKGIIAGCKPQEVTGPWKEYLMESSWDRLEIYCVWEFPPIASNVCVLRRPAKDAQRERARSPK